MKSVFKEYGYYLTVEYLNPKGEQKEKSLAMFRSFKRNKDFFKNWILKLNEYAVASYDTRNPLANNCYVCESSQGRKMFHRKKKNLLKMPYSLIELVMVRIN